MANPNSKMNNTLSNFLVKMPAKKLNCVKNKMRYEHAAHAGCAINFEATLLLIWYGFKMARSLC